jgi:hypothetical protein
VPRPGASAETTTEYASFDDLAALVRAERAAGLKLALAMNIHDAETFRTAALRAGRNNGPALLHDCYFGNRMSRAEMAAVLAEVWSAAEYPSHLMPVRDWVALFREANYEKPEHSMTLYRGTTSGRRRGMSWTTDLEKARWFAGRMVDFGYSRAEVVTVIAPPEAILCDLDPLDPEGRGEEEIVVDPSALPPVRRLEVHTRGLRSEGSA